MSVLAGVMVESRPVRKQRKSPRLPFWGDGQVLQQMHDFCLSFPRGTEAFSAAAWTNGEFQRGRLPPPDLRAALIKAALDAGWRLGYTHALDVDMNAEYRA